MDFDRHAAAERHDRGEFTFAKRDDGLVHCTWCGSITVAEATRLLTTPGTRFSGSDWKYGYPHKFYIEPPGQHHKFYTAHLKGTTDEEFAAFAKAALPTLGIAFTRDEGGLKYRVDTTALAPGIETSRMHGFQAFGAVPEAAAT